MFLELWHDIDFWSNFWLKKNSVLLRWMCHFSGCSLRTCYLLSWNNSIGSLVHTKTLVILDVIIGLGYEMVSSFHITSATNIWYFIQSTPFLKTVSSEISSVHMCLLLRLLFLPPCQCPLCRISGHSLDRAEGAHVERGQAPVDHRSSNCYALDPNA